MDDFDGGILIIALIIVAGISLLVMSILADRGALAGLAMHLKAPAL